MKIAINTLPLQTGHKNRGVGSYTKNLLEALGKDESLDIIKFTKIDEVKSSVDVMHYPWFDLFYHSLPMQPKYPSVITIHDVIPLVFPEHYPVGIRGKINNFFQRLSLGKIKYIITDSQTSKKDIIQYLRIRGEKIIVVPLAASEKYKVLADTQLIYARRKYNLPDNFLLYVGDANWVKNLPFLIQAFSELVKKDEFKKFRLVLVNNVFLKNVENIDHPELESLKLVNCLIKGNNLSSFIIRPGYLETEELVSCYNLATAYIQPSFYEGFGLSILEAMACGTPVICSDVGSLPEVGGKAIVYFKPENLKQFVSILSNVLKDKILLAKLSRLGLEQAKKFSWEKTAEETKKVYFEATKL